LKFFTVLAAAFPVADDALASWCRRWPAGRAAVVCPLEHACRRDEDEAARRKHSRNTRNTLDTRMSFSDEVSNRPWTAADVRGAGQLRNRGLPSLGALICPRGAGGSTVRPWRVHRGAVLAGCDRVDVRVAAAALRAAGTDIRYLAAS